MVKSDLDSFAKRARLEVAIAPKPTKLKVTPMVVIEEKVDNLARHRLRYPSDNR